MASMSTDLSPSIRTFIIIEKHNIARQKTININQPHPRSSLSSSLIECSLLHQKFKSQSQSHDRQSAENQKRPSATVITVIVLNFVINVVFNVVHIILLREYSRENILGAVFVFSANRVFQIIALDNILADDLLDRLIAGVVQMFAGPVVFPVEILWKTFRSKRNR